MSSFSEYTGLVDFDPAIVSSQEPADVMTTRDNLINNGAHLVQSSTQQRANWVTVAGRADNTAGGGTFAPPLIWTSSSYADALPVVSIGPFPITVGPDGLPAKLVLRVAAAVANGSGTILAHVSAYRPRAPERAGRWDGTVGPPPTPGGPDVAQMTTASASPVWLTPSPSYVQITDPSEMAFATRLISMPLGAGGNASTASVVMADLTIWTQSTDPATPTVIHGVYAREFIG